jgi:hypothetical protein
MLAIWLQALLPAVHHPAGMALAGGLGAIDQRNLCHAPGPVSPDEPGKAPAHSMPACALCQAVHAIGGFAPPQAIALAPVTAYQEIALVPPASQAVIAAWRHRLQQPRAPPVLA